MLLNSSQYNISWKKVSKFSDARDIKMQQKIFTNKKDEHLNYAIECAFIELNVECLGEKISQLTKPKHQNTKTYFLMIVLK